MQLTIDPNDDLNDVLRVVAALYDVHLEVVDNEGAAQSGAAGGAGASETAESSAGGEATADEDELAEAAAATPEAEEQAPAARGRRGRGAAGGRAATPRRRRGGAGDVDTAAVRSWARDNGYQVSDRGRISAQIVDAYLAAQG